MLPEQDLEQIGGEVRRNTPRRIIAQIGEYRALCVEALAKIGAEGTVVRTLKGDVIAHPAIRVHAEAAKAEAALLKEWAARTV